MVVPFAAALTLVLAGAVWYLGGTLHTEGLRDLEIRGRLLADTLAHNAELPILAGNVSEIQNVLRSALNDEDVRKIVIRDAEDLALTELRFGSDDATVESITIVRPVLTHVSVATGGVGSAFALEDSAVVRVEQIGKIELLLSADRTAARTQMLQGRIALAGSALLLLCVLLGIGLARIVARPLRELVEATSRIADGDLSVHIPERRQDEVGELATAFNRMARQLEHARAEVVAERDDLETRVRVRTRELESAKQQAQATAEPHVERAQEAITLEPNIIGQDKNSEQEGDQQACP